MTKNMTSGKSFEWGRLNMIDLLELTSSDQLLFIWKILFTMFTKQATLMRMSTTLSLSKTSQDKPWAKFLTVEMVAMHLLLFKEKLSNLKLKTWH